jgi:hypothetical protein
MELRFAQFSHESLSASMLFLCNALNIRIQRSQKPSDACSLTQELLEKLQKIGTSTLPLVS